MSFSLIISDLEQVSNIQVSFGVSFKLLQVSFDDLVRRVATGLIIRYEKEWKNKNKKECQTWATEGL